MLERAKAPAFGYGVASVFFAIFSTLLWIRFGKVPMMVAFPEVFSLAAFVPVLFYFIAHAPREKAGKIAGIASCVIWVVGIGLAFLIPPKSSFIYIPDALLMFGFFPLLFLWRFSWPWLVFGVLNFGIGILLQVIEYSPDNLFPADLLGPKHHLAEYHPAIDWWLTGLLATGYGVCRLIKNVYLMIRKKRSAA
jgi:hypothetical protein